MESNIFLEELIGRYPQLMPNKDGIWKAAEVSSRVISREEK